MVMGSSLVLEAAAIILCLYWLDGKKFRITGKMVCMVIAHIGLLFLCDSIGYNDLFTYMIYLVIAGYARSEFSISFYQVFFRIVSMLVLCAGIQVLSAIPLLIMNGIITQEWMNLAANLLTFLGIFFLYKKIDIQPFMVYI